MPFYVHNRTGVKMHLTVDREQNSANSYLFTYSRNPLPGRHLLVMDLALAAPQVLPGITGQIGIRVQNPMLLQIEAVRQDDNIHFVIKGFLN